MHIPDVQKLVCSFLETEEIIYLRANPPSKCWGGFYKSPPIESKDVKYPFKKICQESARKGLLMVLQWSRAQGYPWDASCTRAAASGGHFEVLKWARSQGCPWDE